MKESGASRRFSRDEHIVVEDVNKRFGAFNALTGIDMTIARGQVAVVIGGSGAGKTTLLRLLIGLDKPTTGSIYVDGQDIVPLSDRQMNVVRRKYGMVFQYAALLDSLTVFDNVAFPLREHTKLTRKAIRDRVLEKLSILGLEGTHTRFPSQMSGGMRKRVALARALMLEPEILVYDEPTSGLDPLTSRMVDDLIQETRDRFGVTSVVISHDMTSALKIADYLYLLSGGSVAAEGTPRDLVHGASRTVKEFIEASGVSTEELLRHQQPAAVKYRS